jgi:hypothetical protein
MCRITIYTSDFELSDVDWLMRILAQLDLNVIIVVALNYVHRYPYEDGLNIVL